MKDSKEALEIKVKRCSQKMEMNTLLKQHHSDLSSKGWVGKGFKFFLVLFFTGWLVGWGIGLVSALKQLSNTPSFLLSCWLILWATGGVYAIKIVFKLIKAK